MREIEFRAWLKKEKKIVNVREINFASEQISFETEDDILYAFFDEIELIEYTGLKDKNGVKIFEGNIMPIWENGEKHLYKVVYDGDCFMLAMLDSEQGSYPLSVKCKQSEVIGNIYDNPELLENQ